jgi:hypothetical protein
MLAMLVPIGTICLFPMGSAQANPFSPRNWQRIAPPKARFSVLLPGVPNESEQVIKRDNRSITAHVFTYNSGDESYSIAYNDFPEPLDVKITLRFLRDDAVGKGRLLLDINVTLNGHPGKLVTVFAGGSTTTTGFYIAGARLYQIAYRSGNPGEVLLHGAPYLKSFQIGR